MAVQTIQGPSPVSGAAQFASHLPGKVVIPSDEQYETVRLGWNVLVDKRPEVIVFVESLVDVIEAVSFARQQNLPISVQSTGHRDTGKAQGSLLINTSRMKDLQIDPEKQTAWVGAGVKWGEVLALAQQHGLAPLLGSTTDVGVVGYSLGGGFGWLGRKYGLSVDSVLRLEVVTPDAQFRKVSPEENNDLFWALLGGGGGFGVVTGMEIRLFPVTQVYAGNLYYPADMAKEVFRRYRQWVENAPDELTTSILLMNYPPLPVLPPALRGQSFVMVRGCYSGPIENGEVMLDFWRNWQTPIIDEFRSMPFTEADSISQDPIEPLPVMITGEWLTDLGDEVVDVLVRHTLPDGGPPLLLSTEVRMMGGAIARVDPESNAYTHRSEKWIWNSIAMPMSPEIVEPTNSHFLQMRAELAPSLTGKIYINFFDGDQMLLRTQDAYNEKNFRRLQEIKKKYDPDNRMISGFTIPPAA